MNYNISNLEDYFYVFNTRSKIKLKRNYNNIDDRINYKNIKFYDDTYGVFVKKLLYLYRESSYTGKEIDSIQKLLESGNLFDRLKGLKTSRGFVKIEVMKC